MTNILQSRRVPTSTSPYPVQEPASNVNATLVPVTSTDHLDRFRHSVQVQPFKVPPKACWAHPFSPATMVYDWENKEEICYRMYIEEKKSLEEIMEYLKEEHKFAPRYASRSRARRDYPYLAVPQPNGPCCHLVHY